MTILVSITLITTSINIKILVKIFIKARPNYAHELTISFISRLAGSTMSTSKRLHHEVVAY